jgi:hypothetical protein
MKSDILAQCRSSASPAKPGKYTVEQMEKICASLDQAFALGWRLVPPRLTVDMAAAAFEDLPPPDILDRRLADQLAVMLPAGGKSPEVMVSWKQSIARGATRYRMQLKAAPTFGKGTP